MEEFFKALKFEQYIPALHTHGFNELELLLELSDEQLEKCFDAVGVQLLGERMKIQNALKAKKISLHDETESAIDFQTHPEGSSLRDFEYPDNVRDILGPNELCPQIRFFNEVFREIFRTAYTALPNVDQFRQYVRGQQIHRWELQEKYEEMALKLKMAQTGDTSNNQLGKIYSLVFGEHVCTAVDARPIETSLNYLKSLVTKIDLTVAEVKSTRKSLYNRECSLRKHWKISQVEYYTQLINMYADLQSAFQRIIHTLETKLQTQTHTPTHTLTYSLIH